MNNLINTESSFCLNFAKKFKFVILLFAAAMLTSFTYSKAMLGMNELHKACMNDDAEKIEILLESGRYNTEDVVGDGLYKNMKPLHIACRQNQKEAVKSLLKKGSFVDTIVPEGLGKGWTPLHFACSNNNKEIVSLLLENGANPNLTNNNNKTPIECTKNDEIKNKLIFISQYQNITIDKFDDFIASQSQENIELLIRRKKIIFKRKPLNLIEKSNNLNNCNIVCELQSKEL